MCEISEVTESFSYNPRFNPGLIAEMEQALADYFRNQVQIAVGEQQLALPDEAFATMGRDSMRYVLATFRPDLVVSACECGGSVLQHKPGCYHIDCDDDDAAVHGCHPENGVITNDGETHITDLFGEIVMWDHAEFSDPSAAIAAIRYVDLYYREGPDVLRAVIDRDNDPELVFTYTDTQIPEDGLSGIVAEIEEIVGAVATVERNGAGNGLVVTFDAEALGTAYKTEAAQAQDTRIQLVTEAIAGRCNIVIHGANVPRPEAEADEGDGEAPTGYVWYDGYAAQLTHPGEKESTILVLTDRASSVVPNSELEPISREELIDLAEREPGYGIVLPEA